MTTLAFLQNQWFKNPERVRRLMALHPHNRNLMIRFALFRGCLTGKRLQSAFGDELCQQIIWEEASPVISGRASACPPADPAHMSAALQRYKPQVVLLFGTRAQEGWRQIERALRPPCFYAPHPASRFPDTCKRLADVAANLKKHLAQEGAHA